LGKTSAVIETILEIVAGGSHNGIEISQKHIVSMNRASQLKIKITEMNVGKKIQGLSF
jgi:hypothetical protein